MSLGAYAAFGSAVLGGILTLLHVFRPRRSLAHWTFAAGMAVFTIEAVLGGLAARTNSQEALVTLQQQRLLCLSFIPGIWLMFSLCYARGDARDRVNKWRWLFASVALLPVAFSLLFQTQLVTRVRLDYSSSYWVTVLGWSGLAVYVYLLVMSVGVLMNLERTFRASVGIMRWRIKFMLLGVAVLFVVRIYTSTQALLFRAVDHQLELLNAGALVVACLLIARSFFRTGDFEVDVYPSQSVLKGSITVLLAGIYLVVVGALAKLAAFLGGDSQFALKAFFVLISIVGLAVLLQSDRARLWLRQYLSRNFQRPLYDYRKVWMNFTAASASRVEQADLCRSLVRLTADMFQVLSVAIWVVDEKKEFLALSASTFLSETKAAGLDLETPEGDQLMRHLELHADPVDIESNVAAWAQSLKRIHPSQFPNGGHRVCVPLVTQGEVVGVITVGDRVGGVVFTLQDFDMLKCVGDHVTSGLRNVHLSQKLLQAKELEAFQTMATFFVHDLKNAASTLNLMLQNLPEHYDDPAFREDSLRGISKVVTHINRLIGRLSHLRHEQPIQAIEMDLNGVVNGALVGLEQGAGSLLQKELHPVPKLMLDREQFAKVVTNLVLNATEAVSQDGKVRIGTAVEGHSVVLTVADNGCGMSAEFLSRGLFRPFQTTKKSGLGIGMFQSKMIVEAHGGRIVVASEPGEGTTFQVFLPIPTRVQ